LKLALKGLSKDSLAAPVQPPHFKSVQLLLPHHHS
jgi:hypothetical protein